MCWTRCGSRRAHTFLQHTLRYIRTQRASHYCTTQHDHLTSLPRYVTDQISFVISRNQIFSKYFFGLFRAYICLRSHGFVSRRIEVVWNDNFLCAPVERVNVQFGWIGKKEGTWMVVFILWGFARSFSRWLDWITGFEFRIFWMRNRDWTFMTMVF